MKIIKVKTREYKDKTYYRYRIDLPEEKIKEAEFNEGDDLCIEAKKGELRLKKK